MMYTPNTSRPALIRKLPKGETRTLDRLIDHYEIEKRLAQRLMQSDQVERRQQYVELYDALFQMVPDHPMLTEKRSPEAAARRGDRELRRIERFLTPQSTFLEIGPGDCSLSFRVAAQVRKVFAVDVSREIAERHDSPANFELIISDGSSIPVPDGSVDFAYSNQLMEHLHPDDASRQLENVYRCLAPGGRYVVITPNRLTGPHDISRYFERSASGFHLCEYTYRDLSEILHRAGFVDLKAGISFRSSLRWLPVSPLHLIEAVFRRSSKRQSGRQTLAMSRAVGALLGVTILARKP